MAGLIQLVCVLLILKPSFSFEDSCIITYSGPGCNNIIFKFPDKVKVYTVASEVNDGYLRFMRSAKYYGIDVETLGLGMEWRGGNMAGMGGGYKVKLLKKTLKKEDDDTIILFTDGYDVVFTTGIHDIIKEFKKFGARILFSAESFCWPDESLRAKYPVTHGQRFLNSGLFIGYASNLKSILQYPIKDKDDDQLYFTKIYLNETERNENKIKLDHKSELFQNLNGARGDVELEINSETGEYFLKNLVFLTIPKVIHGNGPNKMYINSFSNYLAGAFLHKNCQMIEENKIEIEKIDNMPVVSLSVFVEQPTPFFEEFLEKLYLIKYPKKFMHLFIHNNVPYHAPSIANFLAKTSNEYKTLKEILPTDNIHQPDARTLAVQQAIKKQSDYFFSIDSEALLDNPDVLLDLISFNRSFIAPVLSRPKELWSNFWGALSENGFYARSNDYEDIVKQNLRGIWNVPYVSSCYLVKKSILNKLIFDDDTLDPDMAVCANLRKTNNFMYVTNTKNYGHLVKNDDFNPKMKNPDFYMLQSNEYDWEKKYINPEYFEFLKPNATFNQPCPDVYWFPIVTDKFCKDLIEIMESYGKWSDGTNNDERLDGGYEAVPTRDIHMKQVGLDPTWLRFLQLYIRPLQEAVFTGYYQNPPKSFMNFVVRYRPDEQPFLRPHHDSSTYTINIALNQVGVDYEGGGCNFLRYNCSIIATKRGWALMHPGRLTHFHEGLRTVKGTRYIAISFVDP